MIIPIDNQHRIASDRYQWVLQERQSYKNSKTGETVSNWAAVGYFSRLDSLVSALFDLRLRLSDAEGIAEATQEAKRITKQLHVALSMKDKAA